MEPHLPHLDTEQEDTPTNIRLGLQDVLTGIAAFVILVAINAVIFGLFWLWLAGN